MNKFKVGDRIKPGEGSSRYSITTGDWRGVVVALRDNPQRDIRVKTGVEGSSADGEYDVSSEYFELDEQAREEVKNTMADTTGRSGTRYTVKPGREDRCGTYEQYAGTYSDLSLELLGGGSETYPRYEIFSGERRLDNCGSCFAMDDLLERTMAKTLTPAQEALLDEDSKDLLKAGVINADLTINDATFVLSTILAQPDVRKVVADAARAKLEAEKEAKA